MSTKTTPASVVLTEASVDPVETPAPETLQRVDEGIGVFRALILMLLAYVTLGAAIWFAWHAWGHWHAR